MKRKHALLAVIVVLTFATGIVTGQIASNTLSTQQIDIGSAQTQESDLEIQSYSLGLTGNTVTSVDVTIDNTDGSNSKTADVTVTLIASDGTQVAENTNTGVSWNTGETGKTVTVSGYNAGLSSFQDIDIRIEE